MLNKKLFNMKQLIFSFIILSVFSSKTIAQETDNPGWEINSVSFHTGETPLTKGNTFAATFSKQNSVLILDYNKELGEALYFYSPVKNVSVGGSGGVFRNTLWAGPIASLSFFDGHLNTLHWVGWSLGNPEMKKTTKEILFCFAYNEISFSFNGFETYYALQKYQDFPYQHIVGGRKTISLNEKFSTFFSGSYVLNKDHFMWSVGMSYNFK